MRIELNLDQAGLLIELLTDYVEWRGEDASSQEFGILTSCEMAIRNSMADAIAMYTTLRHRGYTAARSAAVAYGPKAEHYAGNAVWIRPRATGGSAAQRAMLDEAFQMLEAHWVKREPAPEDRPPDAGTDTIPV